MSSIYSTSSLENNNFKAQNANISFKQLEFTRSLKESRSEFDPFSFNRGVPQKESNSGGAVSDSLPSSLLFLLASILMLLGKDNNNSSSTEATQSEVSERLVFTTTEFNMKTAESSESAEKKSNVALSSVEKQADEKNVSATQDNKQISDGNKANVDKQTNKDTIIA